MKNIPKGFIFRNNFSSDAPKSCAQNGVGAISHHHQKVDDEYSNLRESMTIPKHVAISLDGNRRWLKNHGRDDIDYTPFFQATIKFVEYCVKWGVGTATAYISGLGNIHVRPKEASDILHGQFERFFLEEGLQNFMRKGVKVSVIGETWMLSKSCQATIKKVEEATKNNTKLDLMLPACYSSQKDIVEATKEICKKVKEGTIGLEDVNEDLMEQHISFCGFRPSLDLYIRTGGELRIGKLLAWQVPHTELYFTDILAPDFGEDVFVDALRSFQQRFRLFGK